MPARSGAAKPGPFFVFCHAPSRPRDATDVRVLYILMLCCCFQMEKNDWLDANTTTYKVYESMFRVIKESENVDERQHCFLIQTVKGESR